MSSHDIPHKIPRTRRLLGSGGYNAALIAELAGPTGHVTTLDIDPAVTERATRFLAETGYDGVRVVTADAEHLLASLVPNGGFDAIVVTVNTWDLPWIGALAEGGRLVAPLRLHGYHWAGWVLDETGKVYGGVGPNARLRLAARVTAVGPAAVAPAAGRPFARLLATPAQAAALLGWGPPGARQAQLAVDIARERWGLPAARAAAIEEIRAEGMRLS
ncbi:methyltransferase domain-containing protein [Streptomyces anthocyanicus]|uniref:methyltransferase domain-containing protein n=1 Tax=Streptomyces anthocyanicus TaxID=68174 RepID=UPI00369E5ED2